MATKRLNFKAEIRYNHMLPENMDKTGWKMDEDTPGKYEPYGGAYTLEVFLEEADLKRYQEAGGLAQPKIDEESGKVYVKFWRPHEHPKHEWAGGPPPVSNFQGLAWDVDRDGFPNRGSICDVEVSVFDAGPKKGSRLERVKVLKVAERTPTEEPAAVHQTAELADDEIPF